jgi:hypothetical protein
MKTGTKELGILVPVPVCGPEKDGIPIFRFFRFFFRFFVALWISQQSAGKQGAKVGNLGQNDGYVCREEDTRKEDVLKVEYLH